MLAEPLRANWGTQLGDPARFAIGITELQGSYPRPSQTRRSSDNVHWIALLEGDLSSSVSFFPTFGNQQGSSSLAQSPLLNRLSGIRSPETAGGADGTVRSALEQPVPSVSQAEQSSSSGDMLETLPDVDVMRKAKQMEVKQVKLVAIPSRIELQLFSSNQKEQSAYDAEDQPLPRLDIRV